MKKTTLWLLTFLFLGTLTATAQMKIPGTHVHFTLPEGEWKYLQTTTVDKNTTVYLYSYNDHYVIDSVGDTIIPFIRIYVRKNYSGSAYELAYSRYLSQPFQSLDEYVEGLPSSDGIGYLGAYTNEQDGKDYEFRMIYFKEGKTVFEFRLETSRDNYDDFSEQFEAILQSIVIGK